MKTIIQRNREEKEKFRVPHRIQDVIPVRAVYSDGLFLVGKDRFSKTFQFQDINYAVASQEDQRSMFMAYCSLLNSLDNNATVKITIHNRRMNLTTVRQDGWIPLQNDKLDHYRNEYNQMLTAQVSGEDAYCQDKYVTVAVSRNLTDARSYFSRVGSDLITQFSRLGSHCEALGAEQRLKILGGILREDTGEQYSFCLKESKQRGHSFQDAVCPNSITVKWNHFTVDGKFGRVLYLRDYASYIKDSLVTELTAMNREILLSIDILPVPMDEAIREVNKRTLGTEASIAAWNRSQNQKQNFAAILPIRLEQERQENREFMNDLTTRNQRMMLCTVTLVHFAEDRAQHLVSGRTILHLLPSQNLKPFPSRLAYFTGNKN